MPTNVDYSNKVAYIGAERVDAAQVAERLLRLEKGDDLPILMEAFGCDYDSACELIWTDQHAEALALFNAAVFREAVPTDRPRA